MKILYVITKANWGGAQRYVFDLAAAMKERGHEVVVAYGTDGTLVSRLTTLGIRTLPLPGLARNLNLFREWKAFLALKKLMRTERPDVVHVNSSKGGLALLAARLSNVPHILFTVHGFAFNEDRPWWQKLILRVVYAFTLLLTDTTICVSEAICRDVNYLPFVKRCVIRNGIDAPSFLTRSEARTKLLPTAPKGIWLGMIAELHPTKRVEDAIDAVAELPDTLLVVLGDGDLLETLRTRALECGVANRVFLLGFKDNASTYLPAFDIFLVPSRTEALAYVAIEAGYAGLPVIASRVGGLPEIIQNEITGLLVPPCHPAILARAVRKLIENPSFATALGAALSTKVREAFTKDRMIAQTIDLYMQ